MLYTGTWTPSENYADLISAEEEALTVLANEATIASLQQQISDLTTTNETLKEELEKSKSATTGSTSGFAGINAAQSASPNRSQLD
jgi:hypothetical protein